MADPHDLNSKVELLKRQNRRLKVALSIVTALLLMATCASTWQAVRARNAEAHARAHAEEAAAARGEAERQRKIGEEAVQRAQQHREADGDAVRSEP